MNKYMSLEGLIKAKPFRERVSYVFSSFAMKPMRSLVHYVHFVYSDLTFISSINYPAPNKVLPIKFDYKVT